MKKILTILSVAMLTFGCSYKIESITFKTSPEIIAKTPDQPSYLILSDEWKVFWDSEITFPTNRRCEFTIIPKPEWKDLDYQEHGTTTPSGYLSTIHDGGEVIWSNPNTEIYEKKK